MSTENGTARPFLKWAGGKRQLLSEIETHLPQEFDSYDTYIEPFIGGGAVLFHFLSTRSFQRMIALDVNPELILCYQMIKSDVVLIIRALKKMKKEFPVFENIEERKEYFYGIRAEWNLVETNVLKLSKKKRILRVAQTIFLNKTCFNGLFRVNSKGKFNVPIGSYQNPTICDEENLLNVSKAIQNVEFHHSEYAKVKQYLGKQTFVYFDPPYRPLTTSSSFTAYSKSGFNDKNQQELAALCIELSQLSVSFLLSNSDPKNTDVNDNFFDDLYSQFNINRVYANRAINSKGSGRGKITEILVRNYI